LFIYLLASSDVAHVSRRHTRQLFRSIPFAGKMYHLNCRSYLMAYINRQ